MEIIQNTIIDFALKQDEIIPEPTITDTTSPLTQTGDAGLFIIGLIMMLIAVLFIFYNYKKCQNAKQFFSNSKNLLAIHQLASKIIYATATLIGMCAIVLMVFGFCQKAVANQVKADKSVIVPSHITAYVDQDTGEVSFDKVTLTGVDKTLLKNLSLGKLEDVDDGDCVWTLTNENTILYNDIADNTPHPVDTFFIEPGKNYDIIINSTISPEVAISLIGKSALSISYEFYSISGLTYGNGVVKVVDENGINIPNHSPVEPGTRLFATVDSFDSDCYTFNILSMVNATSKDFATGYTADFDMPANDIIISAAPNDKEFYATLDGSGNLQFYYDNVSRSATKVYPQSEFDFDMHYTEEGGYAWEWPYVNESDAITSINVNESVKNFAGIKSTESMFSYLYYVTSYTGLSNINTENVTDMEYMFCEASEYVKNNTYGPDLSGWDVTHVNSMREMFYQFGYISDYIMSFPNFTGWNTSNVSNMESMFYRYAESSGIKSFAWRPLTLDLSMFDTSNVTYTINMLYTYVGTLKIGAGWTLSLDEADLEDPLKGWIINGTTNFSNVVAIDNYLSTYSGPYPVTMYNKYYDSSSSSSVANIRKL